MIHLGGLDCVIVVMIPIKPITEWFYHAYVMQIQNINEIVGGNSPYHELRYGIRSLDTNFIIITHGADKSMKLS